MAFEELKRGFTTVPILLHFYLGRKAVGEPGAGGFALGCVFSGCQGRQLYAVAFHS